MAAETKENDHAITTSTCWRIRALIKNKKKIKILQSPISTRFLAMARVITESCSWWEVNTLAENRVQRGCNHRQGLYVVADTVVHSYTMTKVYREIP